MAETSDSHNESIEAHKRSEIGPDTPISEIPPIEKSRSMPIDRSKQIKEYVEAPLRKAVTILFEKNIRTSSTSANQKDVGRYALLFLGYNGLSAENKAIADSLVEKQKADDDVWNNPPNPGETAFSIWNNQDLKGNPVSTFKIFFGVSRDTTAGEIEKKFAEIAESFKCQEDSETYTLKQIRKWSYVEDLTVEQAIKMTGYYYDKEKDIFYRSKEMADHKK